ncbi:MAG TPA: RNA polymerase sigma factor [Byssovorax sp.]|jgi:RNA polymerase sigma-70 factor (ECF subfamily)
MTFREVYDEHFRFAWRSLRRLGVRESDVADAVQDVFLVVHRRLAEFEGRSKVSTWIYGICYRVASDRRRVAHLKREVAEVPAALEARGDDRRGAEGDLDRKQGLELLESILDTMPLEQRAVFTLFELDAQRGEDVAELLDVPLGTVYSRLRLAREHFRRAVERAHARDRFTARAGGER